MVYLCLDVRDVDAVQMLLAPDAWELQVRAMIPGLAWWNRRRSLPLESLPAVRVGSRS